SVSDINFCGRKALLRVDFNVPLDKAGNITDDHRLTSTLPTINKIIKDGGTVIICSHMGRPKGRAVKELSLKPIAERLKELLGKNVLFAEDCIGPEASNLADKQSAGDCLLLENLRFHIEEEENDNDFAKKLSSLADIYVNDAFGAAHRAHASTTAVTKFFPQAVAGLLMEKELRLLGQALNSPDRPLAAIIGGAKVSDKIDIIDNLLGNVDLLLIGGGMVFTFAKAMGYSIGESLLEENKIDLAGNLIEEFKRSETTVVFPTDTIVATEISDSAKTEVVSIETIPDGMKGLDIGPETVKLFTNSLKDARTIIWNGPMGVFEYKPFETGTFEIAKELAQLTSSGTKTIVSGGDTGAVIARLGLENNFTHISTGGGATLEFLEGKDLPGVEVLTDKPKVQAV
ncbi:MAG: phosphoglycerate kinase, partial [candidate division Zixibacteria bacterium]